MEDLIEALKIMLKNGDVRNPTHCAHDELHVYPRTMDFTDKEISRLETIGFYLNEDRDGFYSFRFGSF